MRSVARAVISFGMTAIGIKLFLSARENRVSFCMINPKTQNKIKQRLVDALTEEVVERSETQKGYEYVKDKYVVFTEEEIANMQAEKKDTLDIQEFVPLDCVDPLHVEKTYYTGPDKGMDKGYQLLYQTLLNEKKCAIGTWVSRGKEHLVAIRAYDHGLIMHQMFYDTEVRAFENTCSKPAISNVELAMGKMLVDQFSASTFDKSKYADNFVTKVQAAVDAKLNGKEIVVPKTKQLSSNMEESLKASLLAMGISEDKIKEVIAGKNVSEKPTPKKATKRAPKKKKTA
jgi:DNA end-binding protein Ku